MPDTTPVTTTPPAPDTAPITTPPAPETTKPPVPADTEKPAAVEILPDDIDLTGKLSADKPAGGQFVSAQSEKLKLVVSYSCRMEADGTVSVDLETGLETYDIYCGGRTDLGKITVDGVTKTFSTERIVNEERKKTYIPFTTHSFRSAPGQTSCAIEVSWVFNGTYAGTKIDTLTASAVLSWSASAKADNPA